MIKKEIGLILFMILIILIGYFSFNPNFEFQNDTINTLEGYIIKNENNTIIIKNNSNTYTVKSSKIKNGIGTKIKISCLGSIKNCDILNYKILEKSSIPSSWLDNGIFKDYYFDAYQKLQELSLEEKVAQVLLVHYKENIQEQYQFGGFIFFEKDFKNKTKEEVINMISNLQKSSSIPVLTAIDEEGGIVSRISSNPNLVDSPFKSSQKIYAENGLEGIKQDTIYKSKILKELGLNLNLAPVVDVSTNPEDYIYKRTLGTATKEVCDFAKTVIEASKNSGVSYTLKHFPGYGNNIDTHKGSSIDYKSYEEILENDIPPFKAGIENGAEVIMTSHNTVLSIDKDNSVSLSPKIHEILRKDLNFTGIIITDDLNMSALKNIDNIENKALLAGNNILITEDYEKSYNNLLQSVNDKVIPMDTLNQTVFKILAFKYYKNLL